MDTVSIETQELFHLDYDGERMADAFLVVDGDALDAFLEPKTLEDFTANWLEQPPAPSLKRALIAEVARMAGTMHRAGVNHRDFYICHFLLHTDKPVTASDFRLSLIDLHRAQVRATTPPRWRNKDFWLGAFLPRLIRR